MNPETMQSSLRRQEERGGEPQAIGEILQDLLAKYQEHFPEVRIAVVEVPAAA